MAKALWGGRFKKEMDPLLKCFSYSLTVDRELLDSELEVNQAWAKMLGKCGIISNAESSKLVRALNALSKEFKGKTLEAELKQYEDVHTLIQQSLEKKVGKLGKKIHTGRSRNDLVVTSTRVYLRKKLNYLDSLLSGAQKALVHLAEKADKSFIAGLTHLRMAQPILMAHHLLAYVEMLEEDRMRLQDALKRLDLLVLGSGALAGSGLPLNQAYLAKTLGFSKIATNSLAATSDRAFSTEILAALSMLWMHLSRLSEDFILWNSEVFHYIELDDAFATGSSLMPQKKNPDVFELIRGRAGVIFGYLNAHLTMQKGLPLAYNRDLQEDKPGLFDALRKTEAALSVLAKTVSSTQLNPTLMESSVEDDNLYATDILEYLVCKGLAFAEAHEVVGQVIAHAGSNEIKLRDVPLTEWKKFSKAFDKKIYELFDPARSVSDKKTIGSTNPKRVKDQIKQWNKKLKARKSVHGL